jgi:insertion element IS1 protein InsB
VAADARASGVPKQAPKPWLWSAMDAPTRPAMALHGGARSRTSATRLGATLPDASRQHATFDTAPSVGYDGGSPAAQHRAISKGARKTNPSERVNNSRRQQVSRLRREAGSLSKQLAHHMGALKRFICHYNLTRAAAESEHYIDITTTPYVDSASYSLSSVPCSGSG